MGERKKMGYHLWDPEGKNITPICDMVFNEKKMRKTPIIDVEMREFNFQDAIPCAYIRKQ